MTDPMTPTEQDKGLREAIVSRLQHAYYNRHTDGIAGIYSHAPSILENYTDEIMQLITADRGRVALEARISTLEDVYDDDRPLKTSMDIKKCIAELKAHQEEV